MDCKQRFQSLLEKSEIESGTAWLREAAANPTGSSAKNVRQLIVEPLSWYFNQSRITESSADFLVKAEDLVRCLEAKIPIYPEHLSILESAWSGFVREYLEANIPIIEHGQSMRNGRKLGTVGPVKKAIEKALKANPLLKNREIWDGLKKRPPKGWLFYGNGKNEFADYPGGSIAKGPFGNSCRDVRKQLESRFSTG